MIVRRMEPHELEATLVLWHETSADTYTFIEGERDRTLDDRRRYFSERIAADCDLWVAIDKGTIVGLMALRGGYMDRLYVRPSEQRRGVGTALLQRARELSPEGIELHTHVKNEKGCAFYEKHGFRPVRYGLSPPPENEPDVEYQWRPDTSSSTER